MTLIHQIFCPVCFLSHGPRAEHPEGKPYINISTENFWIKTLKQNIEHFGSTQDSQGRGKIEFLGYFEPESDPTDSYPLVKQRLLQSVFQWVEKGWLTVDEISEALEGRIVIAPIPGKIKGGKKPKVQKEPEPEEGTEADLEGLIEELKDMMDEDNKARSITKLEKRLAAIDENIFDISSVEEAIDEYKDIERTGKTVEEYGDEKAMAFDEINEAIDNIELIEE